MKAMAGKANPQLVNERLRAKLGELIDVIPRKRESPISVGCIRSGPRLSPG